MTTLWPLCTSIQRGLSLGCLLVMLGGPALAAEDALTRLEQELPRESLLGMVQAGGDWILRMQHDSGRHRGRFRYQLDPSRLEEPASFEIDNFLRQAGTTYSLFLVHEATGQKRYRSGAERGVRFLLAHVARDPELAGCAFFDFQGEVKLGGAALSLLALMKLSALDKRPRHEPLIREVTEFLVAMQREAGDFQSIFKYGGSKQHPKVNWDSAIYPGEAMLALTRRYAATRDARILQVLERAFEYYSARPDRYLQSAFIPWTTTAMVELHEQTGDARYASWAVEMTDHMIRSQILGANATDYGAFRPRPGANTGSYLEGIVDAYRLVQDQGDGERSARYRLSMLAGYQFLRRLQYDAAEAEPLGRSGRLLVGGVRGGPRDPIVRIDHTQHAISAIVKGLPFVRPASERD